MCRFLSLMWHIFFACNHTYNEILEFDEYDYHKLRCVDCGKIHTNDPYAGIGG